MNVLLPQDIEFEAIALLERENCIITVAPDPKPETVSPLIKDAHGLILRTGINITRDLIESADELLVISRTGGGLDNVDVGAASDHGIIVTSNLGVNTISVAEHVLAMVLALSKNLSIMDHAVRHSNFDIRYQNLPRDIYGKTIGLLGLRKMSYRSTSESLSKTALTGSLPTNSDSKPYSVFPFHGHQFSEDALPSKIPLPVIPIFDLPFA